MSKVEGKLIFMATVTVWWLDLTDPDHQILRQIYATDRNPVETYSSVIGQIRDDNSKYDRFEPQW